MRGGQSSKKVHISFVHVKIYCAFVDVAMKNRLHLLFVSYKTRSSLLLDSKHFNLLEITHFRRRRLKQTSEQLSIL